MWRVREIEARAVELDFRSSGQGRRAHTSLFADGRRLVNAADLVEFDPALDRVQIVVCEDCGFTNCAPGGWVCLRRVDADVLWLPAFAAMSDEPGSTEYAPPIDMSERVFPVFGEGAYSTLRRYVRALPAFPDVAPLHPRDLALVLQHEAPGRVLGTFPETPSLRRDVVVAVDHGDLAEELTAMLEILSRAWSGSCVLRPCESADAVHFYLDLPGHPVWSPLVRRGDARAVRVADGLNVELADSSA
jgi:hypothetical protein